MPTTPNLIKAAVFGLITFIAAVLLIVAMFVPWLKTKDASHKNYKSQYSVWRGKHCYWGDGGNRDDDGKLCDHFMTPSIDHCRHGKHIFRALQILSVVIIALLLAWCIAFVAYHCSSQPDKYGGATGTGALIAFAVTYIIIWLLVLGVLIGAFVAANTDFCDKWGDDKNSRGVVEERGMKKTHGIWLWLAAFILLTLFGCLMCAMMALYPKAGAKKKAPKTREPTHEKRPDWANNQFEQCGPRDASITQESHPATVSVDSRRASMMRGN